MAVAESNKADGKQHEDNLEFKNFQQLLKQVLSVPKEQIDKRRVEDERERERRRIR